jgi:hypothetical protein
VDVFALVMVMKYAVLAYNSPMYMYMHKEKREEETFSSPHAPHLSKLLFIFYFESFVSYRKCQVYDLGWLMFANANEGRESKYKSWNKWEHIAAIE